MGMIMMMMMTTMMQRQSTSMFEMTIYSRTNKHGSNLEGTVIMDDKGGVLNELRGGLPWKSTMLRKGNSASRSTKKMGWWVNMERKGWWVNVDSRDIAK